MSMTAGYFCLTCRRHAPNASGDGLLLGAPDLRPIAEVHGVMFCEGGTPTFGYLYEPLHGMGIRKPDLVAFASWLEEHAGHELTVDLNSENATVYALLEADPEIDKAAMAMWDAARKSIDRDLLTGGLQWGKYGATCLQCRAEIEAEERDIMAPYTPFQPDAATREMFLTRWAVPDSMFAHGQFGALEMYTFLPDYVRFLTDHRGHPIEVRFARAS